MKEDNLKISFAAFIQYVCSFILKNSIKSDDFHIKGLFLEASMC